MRIGWTCLQYKWQNLKSSLQTLVLLLVDPDIVWYSSPEPLPFDIIQFFIGFNLLENERLFTLKRCNLNEFAVFFLFITSASKFEKLIP